MKIIIVYHPESEHGRTVEEYVHDFGARYPDVSLVSLSVDVIEGAKTAELYDIIAYPAMLAIRENGELAKVWQGLPMPLMNELAFFAIS